MMRISALAISAATLFSLSGTSTANTQFVNIEQTIKPTYNLGSIDVRAITAADIELTGTTGNVLAATTESAPETTQQQAPQPVIVAVAAGDSLSKIAQAHNTTYQRLFDANTEIVDPNIINPGQKIRIPFPDEVLTTRPLPATAPKPTPAPKPASQTTAPRTTTRIVTSAPAVASGSVWDRLAACESGGNWSINTSNGYYGGLQFSLTTWRAVGGQGYPHQNSREEQIHRAEILLARSSWGQWPHCAAKLGLL